MLIIETILDIYFVGCLTALSQTSSLLGSEVTDGVFVLHD